MLYSRNMFYAGGRPSIVAVPFMKDRGTRSLNSLRKLLLMYPSAVVDPINISGGIHQADGVVGDERIWEELWCDINLHLPRLAHLGKVFHLIMICAVLFLGVQAVMEQLPLPKSLTVASRTENIL